MQTLLIDELAGVDQHTPAASQTVRREDGVRGFPLELVVAQIEQFLGVLGPLLVGGADLLQTLLIGWLQLGCKCHQVAQVSLEGLNVLVIAVAELLVAQRQVAAHIGLHAQQVGLGARRHQGRRHAHLVGVADLLSCPAASEVAQPDDQQRQRDQDAEADGQLATDLQIVEPSDFHGCSRLQSLMFHKSASQGVSVTPSSVLLTPEMSAWRTSGITT